MNTNNLSLLTYGAIALTSLILATVTIFDKEAYPEAPAGSDSMDILSSLKNSFQGKQEEVAEEPSEEPSEEVAQEPTEEITEEPTEEITEEPSEEITEEPSEEIIEEPIEEVAEEPTEEITKESSSEVTEEPIEEKIPSAPPKPVGGRKSKKQKPTKRKNTAKKRSRKH
jgi:outer membrane biosynthesis protein TonB